MEGIFHNLFKYLKIYNHLVVNFDPTQIFKENLINLK